MEWDGHGKKLFEYNTIRPKIKIAVVRADKTRLKLFYWEKKLKTFKS
jgi:hypothetical protein